jgi:hypothetical protein
MASVGRTAAGGVDPFAISLTIAAALHLALLVQHIGGAPRTFGLDVADIEVDFLAWDEPVDDAQALPKESEEAIPASSGRVASAASPRALESAVVDAPTTAALDAVVEADVAAPPAGVPSGTAPGAPRPGVRLYLGAGDLRDLVGRPGEQGPSRSAALFSEGLGPGEVGASASGPAVSAGYRAARLGPAVGTAVFEVRTNAAGSVTAVYLVSDDESGVWTGVTQDLLSRLAASVLRLPEGAKGMITRLRIDRGYLAQDLSERGKVQKGAALGQDHHPKDLGWDESTQGSMRTGRLAPTAGVSSEILHGSVRTRVVLLSQQLL